MGAKAEPVYVSVSANIDPERNIERALALLSESAPILAVSTFYESAAVDRPEQADYCNGVVEIDTQLRPRELKFDVLRRIEAELGRVRTDDRYASRPIDLDIVIYGSLVIDEADLIVPDPDIWTRAFLAVPLLELAPSLVLPSTGERLKDLSICADTGQIRRCGPLTKRLRGIVGP